MKLLSKITKNEVVGKTCLLRLNLDVKDPHLNSLRLTASVPTIKFLLDSGADPLIISHRGRPNGSDLSLSLKPCVEVLQDLVGQKLRWLENLRFDEREQNNDESLAEELAQKGDFFVNDDFATLHRKNSSVWHLPRFRPSYAGLLIEKELANLTRVRETPVAPLVVIIGGIKISDKLDVIKYLESKVEYFLMGSAYLKNKDLERQVSNFKKIILPTDWVGDWLDIGPETIKKYDKLIRRAKTIIWNGPIGKFEDERYRVGSKAIAGSIAESGAFSVVGGGDTEALLDTLKIKKSFNFISTGGGAMLDFLADKELPGLKALTYYE